ncbi:hypothetical protein AKG34_24055 [Peribacillus butanolivorans]|uniref:DUF948 domain-containing protein n=1 Tax=Peribacillus butanolivorans TaxID=421767 RepID=UPI0006A73D05|nr:DUF948 domain-containing protein [Peribacillus butanolivorans]KON67051.1 hypothetical protein AKG34_24055 [Peribacillus butanolivorans]MED3690162.1 DUF948 domain-containing protein [Peribacillus butanolivorans]
MLIVYISLALFIGAIFYLVFFALKTYKDTKPAIENVTETVARIQAKTDQIKSETDQLALRQQEITEDVQYKKEAVQYTVDAAKQMPEPFKNIWLTIKGEKWNLRSRRNG